MSHRLPLLAAFVVACLLVLPGAAGADVSLSNVVARPTGAACARSAAPSTNAPAGSHRDLCVAFAAAATSGDDLKDLTIHLAPGLIGDPSARRRARRARSRPAPAAPTRRSAKSRPTSWRRSSCCPSPSI